MNNNNEKEKHAQLNNCSTEQLLFYISKQCKILIGYCTDMFIMLFFFRFINYKILRWVPARVFACIHHRFLKFRSFQFNRTSNVVTDK